ncbi:MAG TPA: DUF3306 domain-containing protein [Thermohalobaculum sp.]|nr:DUF3306 domain-containing protein [Thermohalobaculum sp.]
MTKAEGSGGKPSEAGFASRWSQRKQAAKVAPPLEEPAVAAPASEPPPDERPDDEVLAELGLPDPDTLAPGDDFSAFMAKAVPARLRNRALRRLWRSNPAYAAIDGLVEYGEDYTDAATVIENLQTAYQVGRGFADRLLKADEADADAPESPENQVEAADETDPEAGGDRLPEQVEATGPGMPAAEPSASAGAGDMPPPDDSIAAATPRRRMHFRLAEE